MENYLTIYDYPSKIRLGNKFDGGYVIGIVESKYDFYISAGISNEESFSRDFINLYNMNKVNCAAFDGTIDNYPIKYTKKIIFYKRNISSYKDNKNANLDYFTEHYKNIFLKMDIEGSEYSWLLYLSKEQLNKFKQIVIEFHGINDDSWNFKKSDKIECFKKLADTHYPIHIHGNNNGPLTENIPDVVEITYLRKDLFDKKPILNRQSLPIKELDYPNVYYSNDYDLNFPPFVHK
jgi:hypothetical protein